MELYKLFQVGAVRIPGRNWGWLNSGVEVVAGMPLRIEAFGSIKFGIFDRDLTPDGANDRVHYPDSLGFRELEMRRMRVPFGMLIGCVAHEVFPVGSFRELRAPASGLLRLGHNDTPKWDDNDGEWQAFVYIPVKNVQTQLQGNAMNLQFTTPFGINGQASLNLPQWMVKPNLNVTFHGGASHGQNIQTGTFCIHIAPSFMGKEHGLNVHVQA